MFYFFKIPTFLHKLYPSYLWEMPTNPKAIYLTFDDGPTPEVTDWVLKTLKEYNAKATFFCEGQNVKKHPTLFKKLVASEHRVGNHSFSHPNGWVTNNASYLADIKKATEIMEKVLKKEKLTEKLFRPPYGKIKHKQAKALKKLGYKIVMIDVISGDFDQSLHPEKSLEKLLKYTKPGSIVVFHDSNKALRILKSVLPKVLQIWSKQGYEFLAL